jgi:hypothetical protein
MKSTSIIAALAFSITALPASAMQPLGDFELSQERGRNGITVLSDLKVHIGSVLGYGLLGQALYKLSNLMVSGMLGANVSVISESAYTPALIGSLRSYGIKESNLAAMVAAVNSDSGVMKGTDVIQIAFPALQTAETGALLSINVASAAAGAGGTSIGGVIFKEINPGGTTIWLRSHNR